MRRPEPFLLALGLACTPLAGCGFGTIGAALGLSGGGGGGGGGTPVGLSQFAVDEPEVAPATVRFRLLDPENEPATVELRFRVPDPGGGAPLDRPMTALTLGGLPLANPTALDASDTGTDYAVTWDFAAEPDLPADGSLTADVTAYALVPGVLDDPQLGLNAVVVGLGNDAPEVLAATVPIEADELIAIPFTVADSSGDEVDVRIEYDLVNDVPDAGFQLATPQAQSTPPPFAVEDVVAAPTGTQVTFFWNTEVDLFELESDVVLRLTPDDGFAEGAPFVTDPFRVDNNTVPIASLDGAALIANPDRRRGIAIPFEVLDAEFDRVRLVFQFREPGGVFPALPTDASAMEALLEDPVASAAAQIATPYPRVAEGPIETVDATTVRLAGIGRAAPWYVAQGLEGLAVDVVRERTAPDTIAASWVTTVLDGPAGVAPGSAPDRALVLDRGPGGWRLRDIELATGDAVDVAVGPGEPGALSPEAGGASVLVASESGGDWRVERVDLASGTVDTLFVRTDPLPTGAVRGLAARGPAGALVTVDDTLFELDLRPGLSGVARPVVTGLGEPRDVVLAPGRPDLALLAETAFDGGGGPEGRLVWVDLRRGACEPVTLDLPASPSAGGPDLVFPRALAFAPDGSRLLLSGERASDGLRGVFEASLGAHGAAEAALLTAFTADVDALAFGPRGQRLATLRTAGELAVGGGVRARLSVESFDAGTELATLAGPLAFATSPGERWSVASAGQPFVKASPTGVPGSFAWDSRDVPPGGAAFFRAVPFDTEQGFAAATGASKPVGLVHDVDAVLLDAGGGTDTAQAGAVGIGDVDGDGRLDLAALFPGDEPNLELYLQDAPRSFTSLGTLPSPPGTEGPVDLELADVDGDGDLDVVTANETAETFSVWRQAPSGLFELASEDVLGDSDDTPAPFAIEAADLDADGVLELLGSHANGVSVFVADSGGVYSEAQVLDDGLAPARAADVDRDGTLDVVLGSSGGNGIRAHAGIGAAAFESSATELTAPLGFDAREVFAGDLGAGGPSLVADDGNLRLTLAAAEPTGGFGAPTELALPPAAGGFQPGELAACDTDGDGVVDLVAAERGSPRAALYRGLSSGGFAVPAAVVGTSATLLANETEAACLAARDLDGDGAVDLVLGTGTGLAIHFPVRGGEFTSGTSQAIGTTSGSAPRQLLDADLDGDGDRDLVLASATGPPSLRLQRAPTLFDSVPLAATTPAVDANRIACGDLDGDGDVDLVHAEGTQLALRYQTGSADFAPTDAVVLDDPRFAFDDSEGTNVLIGDVDGDGDADLVFSNPQRSSVFVLPQDEGAFDPADAIELEDSNVLDEPRQLALADLDRDGSLDLVVADVLEDALVVFPNVGDGFDVTMAFALPAPSANLVLAADLDGDGRPDLVTNSPSGNTIRVRYQAFDGSFGSALDVAVDVAPPGADARALRAVDADGDGRTDLVIKVDQRLVVLRQGAPRRFVVASPGLLPAGAPATNLPSEGLVATDLDGDGDPDLAAGGLFGFPLGVVYGSP